MPNAQLPLGVVACAHVQYSLNAIKMNWEHHKIWQRRWQRRSSDAATVAVLYGQKTTHKNISYTLFSRFPLDLHRISVCVCVRMCVHTYLYMVSRIY